MQSVGEYMTLIGNDSDSLEVPKATALEEGEVDGRPLRVELLIGDPHDGCG